MKKYGKICLTNLNQHSMSFNKNLQNIQQSIDYCIKNNCQIRTGIELETTGQSLGSHFLEKETTASVWYMLQKILEQSSGNQLLIELGMPLKVNDNLHSAMAYLQDGNILHFRLKQILQNTEKSQQSVFLTEWNLQDQEIELPDDIQKIKNQKNAKITQKYQHFKDLNYFSVFEEELDQFIQNNVFDNVDVLNIVTSQIFEAEKFTQKLYKFQEIAKRYNLKIFCGGLVGTEGSKFIHQGGHYYISQKEIQELNKRFKLDQIQYSVHNLESDKQQNKNEQFFINQDQYTQQNKLYEPMSRVEEINAANCLYLWNQMLKTGACGFFTPLSGGADSGLTSMFLYSMCKEILQSNNIVRQQFTKLTGLEFNDTTKVQDLVNKIYYTAYLPMKFSSQTKDNSKKLATAINSNHMIFSIQESFDAIKDSLEQQLDMKIDFLNNSNSIQQDLILQNVQARTRLVLSYALAQSLVVKKQLKSFLLVFATGNFSEVCRGYYSKYDNSSGDLNLVGSLCKKDIWDLLRYYSKEDGFQFLEDIANQKPTAELRPGDDKVQQTDEQDMGFTYEELDFLGQTWKNQKLGFWQLTEAFQKQFKSNNDIAYNKVKDFFKYLTINRHKSICLPPTSHLTDYNIDNNNDIRPMNYYQDNLLKKEDIMKYI